MKAEKEVRMLMESFKCNWSVGNMIGYVQSTPGLEDVYRSYVKALAWVLGDDDIALKAPEHYSEEGCHSMNPQSKASMKAYNALMTELKE